MIFVFLLFIVRRGVNIVPIETPELLFLCPPKTGSTWLKSALKKWEVSVKCVGEKHSSEIDDTDKGVVTTVRCPLNWYESLYRFATHKIYPTFDMYVESILQHKQDLMTGFQEYLRNVDYVMRQETLQSCLQTLLRKV